MALLVGEYEQNVWLVCVFVVLLRHGYHFWLGRVDSSYGYYFSYGYIDIKVTLFIEWLGDFACKLI